MYARKLLKIALAVVLALMPIAQANALTANEAEAYVQTALWATEVCATAQNVAAWPEHFKQGVEQHEIRLDVDRILTEIGPEAFAAALAKGYRWKKYDICNEVWKAYGPEGRGYIKAGDVAAAWKAQQDMLHQLQERERQLIEEQKDELD